MNNTTTTDCNWNDMVIGHRRALLRAADLWDGNTYAAREWNELPKHIQADIQAAHTDLYQSLR